MPTALFRSTNLIGDAVNIFPALRAWRKGHQDWGIEFLVNQGHTEVLYRRIGVPLHVITCEGNLLPHYDFEHHFDVGKAFSYAQGKSVHIAQAYAELLGVEIDTLKPTFEVIDDLDEVFDAPSRMILLSPFSKSCSSQSGLPANKMLPWPKWQPIIRLLQTYGLPIKVLGAKGDYEEKLQIGSEDYLTGLPLNEVAWILKNKTALLVTVDNGMSHLAASQETPTFLMYPECLDMHWIAPWGNPNVTVVQINPVLVSLPDLMFRVRQAIPKLLEMNRG